jgi:hypothetical protein
MFTHAFNCTNYTDCFVWYIISLYIYVAIIYLNIFCRILLCGLNGWVDWGLFLSVARECCYSPALKVGGAPPPPRGWLQSTILLFLKQVKTAVNIWYVVEEFKYVVENVIKTRKKCSRNTCSTFSVIWNSKNSRIDVNRLLFPIMA